MAVYDFPMIYICKLFPIPKESITYIFENLSLYNQFYQIAMVYNNSNHNNGDDNNGILIMIMKMIIIVIITMIIVIITMIMIISKKNIKDITATNNDTYSDNYIDNHNN